ncbi:hypothetical protein MJO29_016009 [Puccinia striiformis f. sp. tritici]|uniref:Thaumatin-like protein n=4 Tax=Puccinia striiformis TaxID=27350 RepID=A0A0L0V8P8_9BASI|nr:hypothetical protein Pst134EA_030285 [Puccinia striiformis f. sp. tritici]KAI9600331.1 hypothetical protein H4Q26_000111 [Puccinia striiformis f. sp. tritici PST-130]KNE95561.1 hypothetical protein PSTG_11165 [Puccinia striiformis f. sp. tritici PST-78]POW02403.1 hypothetical protein PSHT_12115 [Puccinia striiformis]KAH9440197.1 hypothetical protein Pst134EB_030825 [Puccinia striiformis f. sp. tritici]KAH9446364.1 hypothetical protein Pst134EA_030285 [Puccinia striiformis f. sp. tritici]
MLNLLMILGLTGIYMTMVVEGYTLHFKNNCNFPVWPAVGKAPNGHPDPSISYGKKLNPTGEGHFEVNDREIGIRSWARTGCDANGANCATGACRGGLRCNDGGITSRVLLGEYGYQSYGNVISWDLSRVDGSVNIDTSITNDGNVKTCRKNNCPTQQAFAQPNDFQALTTSPVGSTFRITFCA